MFGGVTHSREKLYAILETYAPVASDGCRILFHPPLDPLEWP